ncbi:MAG: Ig-like domain-containing protein [Isosphaeraceae bacterium]
MGVSSAEADPTSADNSAATRINVTSEAPPQVTGLYRFGIHWQPTRVVLTFSRPMDAASVQFAANYAIVTGPQYHYRVVRVVSARYDAATQSVILTPAVRLNVHYTYTLVVNAQQPFGVKSAAGLYLDGAGNGTAGTNLVRRFGIESLVIPGKPAPVRVFAVVPRTRPTR